MAKKITQDYFDSIVKENIEDFDMSEEDAIADAIKQLESQGCDLSTIVKFSINEQNGLVDALKALENIIDTNDNLTNFDEINKHLTIIKQKLDKDLSFRVLATKKCNANDIFEKYLNKYKSNGEAICVILPIFSSYITNQTDVLSLNTIKTLIELISVHENDVKTVAQLLKCISKSCILCESNRQTYVEHGLCESALNLFKIHKEHEVVLVEVCQLIRSLLLDDDLRVEFGKSHEHAKYIVSKLNGLDVLLMIGLSNQGLNEDTLSNITITLSKLAVRNEYCQEICDKGGLKFVIKCIEQEHLQNLGLLKGALSLLKSICNNDSVKVDATKSNAVFLLVQVLNKYCSNPSICELICASLSTILLRNLEASEELVKIDGDLLLLRVLSLNLGKPKVLKFCCMAIRNMISRNKKLGDKLINANVEDVLRTILNQNDEQCYEETKAVLRDLGLHVELKELWTGSGKQLAN